MANQLDLFDSLKIQPGECSLIKWMVEIHGYTEQAAIDWCDKNFKPPICQDWRENHNVIGR